MESRSLVALMMHRLRRSKRLSNFWPNLRLVVHRMHPLSIDAQRPVGMISSRFETDGGHVPAGKHHRLG